jgi:hypothetical protein
MDGNEDVQRRYAEALESLIAKVQQDPYILAAVLVGSLSYDVVWEKSDIDLLLITQETKQKLEGFALVENGVLINASLCTRSKFRQMLEGAVQSSFIHSMLMKGRILFTRDETLHELFANRGQLGTKDQEIRLLTAGFSILPALAKAEKWLYVKQDLNYSFHWIMKLIDGLATIEVVMNGEITDREVVHKALRYNPTFFNTIYTDLINQPKTIERLTSCLDAINTYLRERAPLLFRPIFIYLAEAHGIRSASEVEHYFSNQMNVQAATLACEWLADEGFIQKVSSPVRLTEKSRVDMEESAYYYEGETTL